MQRNFNKWITSLRENIVNYNYYVDFNKIYSSIALMKVELNILNSLIGSKDIENDFEALVTKYPETLKCIPILLAVRSKEISICDGNKNFLYDFNNRNFTLSQCKVFMQETGLFNLLSRHIICSLLDYVTGVEVGLDSNARKNRSGHLMEDLVESYIINAGFIKNKSYFKEMYVSQIAAKWKLDLSAISNAGKAEKRFDFVIKTEKMVFGIETNFYSSGGSKLNETARSYKTLALESESIDGFTFVWITDGKGWLKARNNLEETFDCMPHLYNINDMLNGIMKEIFFDVKKNN